MAVGIEKGSLKNALIPYLEDQMRRMGVYPNIIEVTHGGKKKTDRITWSLQGRFEHGRILLKKNEKWNKPLVDQLLDFPNPLSHDDLPDALSYIDQVATTDYAQAFQVDDWEPIDAIAGY
jgi:predicted phage terminase large subunit-like protein